MYTQLRRSKPGSRVIDDLTLEMTIITEWLREGEAGESADTTTTTSGAGSISTAAEGDEESGSNSVLEGYERDDTEEVEGAAVVGGGGNSGMMNGILQMGDNTASRATSHTLSSTTFTPAKGAPLSSTFSHQDKKLLDIDSESDSGGDWPDDDFDDLMDTLIMQGDDIPEGIIDDDEFERHINNMVKKSSATSSTVTINNTEKPKKLKKVSSMSDSNRQPTPPPPPPPAEPVYIPLYYDDDDDDVIEFVGARGSSLTPMDYERLLDSN